MSLLRGTGARLAAGAILALLALSGCSATPAPSPATVSATPTAAPIFANDDEALAAAKKAYGAYQNMSDVILSEGGEDADRIRQFTSRGLADAELAGFARARSLGYHTSGHSEFDNLTLQDVNLSAAGGIAAVTAYLCSDVSGTDVLNSEGKSVVSSSRRDRTPFEVGFDLSPRGSGELVVGSREVWAGEGVC